MRILVSCLSVVALLPLLALDAGAQNAVTVTDDVSSSADLSNGTDYDSAAERGLVVKWSFSYSGVVDYHVYVSVDGGQSLFLGRTGSGTATYFEWKANGMNVAPAYRSGPQFGRSYRFGVFPIKRFGGHHGFHQCAGAVNFLESVLEPEGDELILWNSDSSPYELKGNAGISIHPVVESAMIPKLLRCLLYAYPHEGKSALHIKAELSEGVLNTELLDWWGNPNFTYSSVEMKRGVIELSLPETVTVDYKNVYILGYSRKGQTFRMKFSDSSAQDEAFSFIVGKIVSLIPGGSIAMDVGELESIIGNLKRAAEDTTNPKAGTTFERHNQYDSVVRVFDEQHLVDANVNLANDALGGVELVIPCEDSLQELMQRISSEKIGVYFMGDVWGSLVSRNDGGNATIRASQVTLIKDEIDISNVEITPQPTAAPTATATPTPKPGEITGETYTVPLNLPSGAKPLELVRIPHGTFMMGSPSNEKDRGSDEGPQHQVTLTRDFYMGKYEVTQAQWQAVMESNPSYFGNKPNNPVERVSCYDCVRFCNELSERKGLTKVYNESTWEANMNANGYRLPTEAEWEYACRAGTTSRFYWGDDLNYTEIDDYAWYWGNSSSGTKEVGLKLPNDFGLYDMSGNVWEWCTDWYDDDYYSRSPAQNPVNIQSNQYRVLRGGSWNGSAWVCRSADRDWDIPNYTSDLVGFRVTRTP